MTEERRTKRLLRMLGGFVTIRPASISPADPRLVDFAHRLVLDNDAYARFKRAPDESINNAGINPRSIDIEWISSVVEQLRLRATGMDSVFELVATEQQQKETDQATHWSFSQSSSSTQSYESHASFDQGYSSQSSTGESTYTNKNFSASGIGRDPESMLRHELKLLFFPGQPLVTPGLIANIRAAIAKARR